NGGPSSSRRRPRAPVGTGRRLGGCNRALQKSRRPHDEHSGAELPHDASGPIERRSEIASDRSSITKGDSLGDMRHVLVACVIGALSTVACGHDDASSSSTSTTNAALSASSSSTGSSAGGSGGAGGGSTGSAGAGQGGSGGNPGVDAT